MCAIQTLVFQVNSDQSYIIQLSTYQMPEIYTRGAYRILILILKKLKIQRASPVKHYLWVRPLICIWRQSFHVEDLSSRVP